MNRHEQQGVIAVVCRDQDGLFLGSSVVVFVGLTDPTTLEFYEFREAFALATDLNLQRVHVASDCEGVINDIRHESDGLYGAIIREIKMSRSALSPGSFSHECRTLNIEANNVAKFGCNIGPGRHI